MGGERLRDVVEPEWRAGLLEEPGERAEERDEAPVESRLEDERVQPVRLGLAPEKRHQGRLDRRLDEGDVDRPARGSLDRHVVEPDARVLLDPEGRDAVGALVDDAEPQVLEERHALGKRHRAPAREHLEVGAGLLLALAPPKLGGPGRLRRQALEDRDVGDRLRRGERLAIGGVERRAVACREGARGGAVDRVEKGVPEEVAPGADDRLDPGLDRGAVDLRRGALGAADDEQRPGERPLRVGRVGGGHPPVIDIREIGADALADARVVAVLRHEDEHGDEPIEPVDSGQRAHARVLVERQDAGREVEERLDVELEQLVARIGVEDVEKRAARIARRIVAGAAHDLVHLPAQERDVGDRARIGRGREQADDPQLAPQPALGGEQLDADIVHVDAPVDARLDVRLGDDERHRLGEERADLGRHRHEFAPAPQHLHVGVGEDAEAFLADEVLVAFVEPIFAGAEKREMVGGEPFEEGERLGDLVGRKRRRVGPIGLDGLADPAPHRGPVADGRADVRIGALQPGDQPGARGLIVDPVEVNLDQALAPRARGRARDGLAREAHQAPRLVALDGEDRVGDEPGLDSRIGEFRERRVEQERHVVVDDFDDRQVASALPERRVHIDETDVGASGLAWGGEGRPGAGGEGRERLGRIGGEILRRGAAEQAFRETRRRIVRAAPAEPARGRRDQGRPRLVVLPRHPTLPLAARLARRCRSPPSIASGAT